MNSEWWLGLLAGLAKGLVFARRPPLTNPWPRQNSASKVWPTTTHGKLSRLQAELLRDMAERLQYDAQNELSHSGRESVFPEGVSANDFLTIPYMTGALQFLSRKTSVSGLIIRRHLGDVAYYVGRNEMREAVLDVVRTAVQENSAPGDDLVVLGHGLGSIVAYDVLDVVALIHPAGAGVPATVRASDLDPQDLCTSGLPRPATS
jgi:hypothetical protein